MGLTPGQWIFLLFMFAMISVCGMYSIAAIYRKAVDYAAERFAEEFREKKGER